MTPGTLVWQPFFPPPVVAALGLAAAATALFAYARSYRRAPFTCATLGIARIALAAALCAVLLGPSRVPPRTHHAERGDLFVLADLSGSMRTADMDGLSRHDFAARHWLDDARLAEWGDRRAVQFRRVGERMRPAAPDELRQPAGATATDDSSRLARNVEELLDSLSAVRPGSAALLLSDGHDSDGESFAPAAARARERGLPVFTVCLGGPRLERDLHLVALCRQPYLFAGETGLLSARVFQSNAARDRTMLHVTHAGVTRSFPIAFDGQAVAVVDIPVTHAAAGVHEYRFVVDPVPDELETRNNEQVLFVETVEKRIRALLLEGEPHWETKFLAQALRRDDRIALTQVSQLSMTRAETLVSREDAAPDGPTTRAELYAFDVVILGRHIERVVPAEVLAALPAFVDERGGALLFARGRIDAGDEPGPLALVEPVTWTEEWVEQGVWQPTGLGRMHPVFRSEQTALDAALRELPPFPRTAVARPKPAAQELALLQGGARDEPTPALVAMTVGRGTVLMVLSEGLWTWRLLAPRQADWRNLYDRFWSNAVRWLALGGDFVPGEQVALRLSHQSVAAGEEILIDAYARYVGETAVHFRLSVTDPDGARQQPALETVDGVGLHRRARYTPTVPGVHTVALEAPGLNPQRRESGLNVYALDQERLQSAAMPEALRLLAEGSGGRTLDPRQPERFVDALARVEAAAFAPARPQYVWDRTALLFLLLSWAGAEWMLRRLGGLL